MKNRDLKTVWHKDSLHGAQRKTASPKFLPRYPLIRGNGQPNQRPQVNKRGDEADSATVVTDGLGGSSNFGGSSGSAKLGEVVLPRRRRRR